MPVRSEDAGARGWLPFATVAFRGWPHEAIGFFEGLEADNSKSYWQAHKDVYEAAVKAPMEVLLGELEAEFGAAKLFRPYRDTRFSRDKTPYKTNIAARVGAGYVSLSSDGLSAGAGMVHLTTDQLVRYRQAVDDRRSGSALEAAVAAVKAKGHECGSHELKTAPAATRRTTPGSSSSGPRASSCGTTGRRRPGSPPATPRTGSSTPCATRSPCAGGWPITSARRRWSRPAAEAPAGASRRREDLSLPVPAVRVRRRLGIGGGWEWRWWGLRGENGPLGPVKHRLASFQPFEVAAVTDAVVLGTRGWGCRGAWRHERPQPTKAR